MLGLWHGTRNGQPRATRAGFQVGHSSKIEGGGKSETKMNDAVAKGPHKPESPGDHFPDFHHQESRIKALEDALAKQRAVNEALSLLIEANLRGKTPAPSAENLPPPFAGR
jgi:hypothetical protein